MNHAVHKGVMTFYAEDAKTWREWLANQTHEVEAVWLEIYKMDSGRPTVSFEEAVDQALCFGWIDSKVNKKDELSYYQYFTRRNPLSNWSKVNKEKVNRLIENGLMSDQGLRMVEMAKKSGTWDALNDVENLIIPDDLAVCFNQYPCALENWHGFPSSVRRGILEWIFNAKRPSTRQKRIKETAQKAAMNVKANQYTS